MDSSAPTSPDPMPPTQPDVSPKVIQVQKLSKVYRTGFWMNQRIQTLNQCTLDIYEGETFGLLGQNGAGKTTLLKILLGIVRPNGGAAKIFGKPLGDRSIKHRVGYLPENPYFYDYLTGWELLEYTAGLFQIPKVEQKKRIPDLLDLVGLARSDAQKKQLRRYSKGMLQRVGVAQALVNDPDLVFLDEPMSGLDPLGRFQIREIIQSLQRQGKTIFFNSHVLSDVELICDRIGILANGELICVGNLDDLLGMTNLYRAKVRDANPEVLRQWMPDLQFKDGVWEGHLKGQLQDFFASLQLMEAQLVSMSLARPTLEEYFIQQLRVRGIKSSQ
ncbi:MAG: ABC transporter ATP-binding protein [Cyanobacteria bacterium J06638_22]